MRKIYAHHAHVFPERIKPDGTIGTLKAIMDDCGIEKCVCFAPFYEYFQDGTDANNWLAEAIRHDDALVGFGVIDFTNPDYAGQVKHIVDLGFKGIKIHPAFQKMKIDGPACCAVYEEAQKHDLVISYHTGIHWHRIADYNMLLYDEVAFKFPALRLTLEHVGGYCFFNEALAVMLNNRRGHHPPRVYGGLTSVFDRGQNRPWFLSDQQVKDLLWQAGEDTAIFGLDFPFNDGKEIKRVIGHIEEMDISEEVKDAILGGNLKRLLNLN